MSPWRTQAPRLYETNYRIELFTAASLQYVLYGTGLQTRVGDSRYRQWAREEGIAKRPIRESRMQAETLIASLPTNCDMLNRVRGQKEAGKCAAG